MGTFANSISSGPSLFAKTRMIFIEKKTQFYLKIITCDPSNYTKDHPKYIVSNQRIESISA